MKLAAVIFDLNGTILEDEDEYGRAFNSVLKSLGVESGTEIPQTRGIGVKENWPGLIKKYSVKTDKSFDVLAKETQDAYLKEISSVTVRSDFDNFIESLKSRNIKVALATSNSREVTMDVLEKVGLGDVFDTISTTEEVPYAKPAPDLFVLSADKLGVERHECLVIEDSASGVEAARRAGMKVVAIDPTGESKDLDKADLVVEGFAEITPQAIDQL